MQFSWWLNNSLPLSFIGLLGTAITSPVQKVQIKIQDLLKFSCLFASCPLWFRPPPLPTPHSISLCKTTQGTEKSFQTTENREREMEVEPGLPALIFPTPFSLSPSFLLLLHLPPPFPPCPSPQRGGPAPWPFMSLSVKPHGCVSLLLLGHGGPQRHGSHWVGTVIKE